MKTVIIVGGGIGGLTAALGLHAAGYEVDVFESAREIRELGVGINIQPHAVRELSMLGLAGSLAASAMATEELVYFNKFGQRIWGEPRGLKAGLHFAQYSVSRGRLQLLLLEAARVRIGSQRIHTNHHLAAFDQDAARVTAHFTDRHTGDPVGSHRADLLIGADGIHSTVRKAFYPDEGTPKWAGQLVWRGVTRAEPCFNGKTMIVAGDHRRRIVAYPIEPLPGADGLTSINWVAEETFDDQAMPPREDWNRERPTADILPYFSNWKFDWLDVPALLAGAPAAYEFPKVDRDPIERWSFGRVTLLGDAAHPMMPHGGNGASQAILDVAALVEALAGNEDAEGGLVAYQASRLPQVSELVRVNREMLGPALVLRLADERAPNGFASVYDVISKEELETISRSYAQLTGLGQASE